MNPTDPKKPKWEQNIRKLKELEDLTKQMSERYRVAREEWVQPGVSTETRSFVAAYKSGRTLIMQLTPGAARKRAILDAAGVAFNNPAWAVAFQLNAEAVVIQPEAPGIH
jgi:hypothetical protein